MRIMDLRVENIGKIKLFELKPEGESVVIGGRNGQGKSTVLMAIEMLLEGKGAFPDVPVREGADSGFIAATLEGGFIVERKVAPDGKTTLVVKNTDGAKYSSPQSLLDSFRGHNFLDPLKFCALSPKQQMEQLRELVGLDFTELDAERQRIYAERTDVNRGINTLKATLEQYSIPEGIVGDLSQLVKVSEVLEELDQAEKHNQQQSSLRHTISELERGIDEQKHEIDELRERLEKAEEMLEQGTQLLEAKKQALAEFIPVDELNIRQRLLDAEQTNNFIRTKNQYDQEVKSLESLEITSAELTKAIEDIDLKKNTLLANINFPVEGLSFDSEKVMLNGLPFTQASQAEKLRVSTAMAFALQPKLKVVLVRDASLLDSQNLKLVCDIASIYGGHVWLERVGEGEECTLILEDGEIIARKPQGAAFQGVEATL